jgi:predicted O-linked N-acetylglucosamine transferase (SPINDLY family)
LRQDAFVFSCFNANYKITPPIFSAWMRILGRVPGSSLFLYAGSRAAEQNIRREAARSGVDPGRVVFGEKLPFEEYLARYRAMDLFLDTLPYNAGTTASDALWAGVPVLTCTGHAFAGRVAASLLTAVDLPELITDTLAQYEDAAVMLATDPEKLAKIRQKLARNRASAPLFDTVRFTRNLEAAFLRVLMLRDENGQPDDIHADDLGRGAAIER